MRLVVFDISGFCHRIFYKSDAYFDEFQKPVSMVVGVFERILLSFCEKSWATHVVFCFDHPSPSFRNGLYPEYKGNRGPRDVFYDEQYEILRKTLLSLGLSCLQKEGYEADDLVASLVESGSSVFSEICVVSYDKDLLQLVCDAHKVSVFNPFDRKIFRESDVFDKLGVRVSQVVDFLALCGDQADNIPGLRGYGEKTARSILSKVDTLEDFFMCPEIVKKPSLIKTAYEEKDRVFLFRRLVSLEKSLCSDFSWSCASYDASYLVSWYRSWFKSLQTFA